MIENEKELNLTESIKKFEEITGKNFEGYYNKFLPKLVHYCTKFYNGDEDKAWDNAQDAFFKALSKLDSYNSEKAVFSTWLFTIAKHDALQNIKKSARIPTISMDCSVDDEGTKIRDFIQGDYTPDDFYLEEERITKRKASIMLENIQKLKPAFKEVITMRDVNHMSYKNIADALGEDTEISLDATNDFIKLPNAISKIYEIKDENGNKVSYETLVKNDSPFYTHIKVDKACRIECRIPQNLSTVKSKIRNGRLKLQKMVKEDFNRIENIG